MLRVRSRHGFCWHPTATVGSSLEYANPESCLGSQLSEADIRFELVLRHLVPFGPATVKDVQAWSGMVRLSDSIKGLKPALRSSRANEAKSASKSWTCPSDMPLGHAPATRPRMSPRRRASFRSMTTCALPRRSHAGSARRAPGFGLPLRRLGPGDVPS